MTQSFVVFTPNRLSAGDALIPADTSSDLFTFLRNYFFGYTKGVASTHPYTEVDDLIESLGKEKCDTHPLYESFSTTCVGNLRDYLQNVRDNFGGDSIVICSELD